MSDKQNKTFSDSVQAPTGLKLLRLRLVSIWYRVSVGKRLWILGLMSLVMFAFPGALYMIEANKAIATSRNEIAGAPVIRGLFPVMKGLQAHRGLSNGLLGGKKEMDGARA
ncbi:MAG: hypothetical protein ABL931_24030, partial [Usitatibacteraceae bacterium]